MDPPRADRGPGQIAGHGAAAGPGFRTKGQLAIDISTDAARRRDPFDFACGDEVYGSCTQLREFFEAAARRYVLRVPSNFTLTLAAGTK